MIAVFYTYLNLEIWAIFLFILSVLASSYWYILFRNLIIKFKEYQKLQLIKNKKHRKEKLKQSIAKHLEKRCLHLTEDEEKLIAQIRKAKPQYNQKLLIDTDYIKRHQPRFYKLIKPNSDKSDDITFPTINPSNPTLPTTCKTIFNNPTVSSKPVILGNPEIPTIPNHQNHEKISPENLQENNVTNSNPPVVNLSKPNPNTNFNNSNSQNESYNNKNKSIIASQMNIHVKAPEPEIHHSTQEVPTRKSQMAVENQQPFMPPEVDISPAYQVKEEIPEIIKFRRKERSKSIASIIRQHYDGGRDSDTDGSVFLAEPIKKELDNLHEKFNLPKPRVYNRRLSLMSKKELETLSKLADLDKLRQTKSFPRPPPSSKSRRSSLTKARSAIESIRSNASRKSSLTRPKLPQKNSQEQKNLEKQLMKDGIKILNKLHTFSTASTNSHHNFKMGCILEENEDDLSSKATSKTKPVNPVAEISRASLEPPESIPIKMEDMAVLFSTANTSSDSESEFYRGWNRKNRRKTVTAPMMSGKRKFSMTNQRSLRSVVLIFGAVSLDEPHHITLKTNYPALMRRI